MPAQVHKCKNCGIVYDLPKPDGLPELLSGERHHVSIGEHVFTYCPECGEKQWADERRFFFILGPKAYYLLYFLIMLFVLWVVFKELFSS